jgi:hypothetical protein
MKVYWEVRVQFHAFLTSALDGDVSGQLHAPATLPPGKETRYPLDRRLGGPQNGLNLVVKRKIPSPHSSSL